MVLVRNVLVLWALAVITPTGADNQTGSPAPVNPRSQFDRMTHFLSSTQLLQTTASMGYDVVQDSGQKIEFSERRRITVARPDRLRVEMLRSNGEEGMVLFDGQRITVYSAAHEGYAEAEIPGSLDEVLVHFLRDLKMRMPLALMFSGRFPQEMEKRLEDLTFVEVSVLTDTPCVHLAGRTDQVDFQVWIPQTGDPLPRRLTITYRDQEGQPEFWADFSNWNIAPTISSSDFTFTPPAGSERIPFLAEMDRVLADENRKGSN
jgi:hypothetical protein